MSPQEDQGTLKLPLPTSPKTQLMPSLSLSATARSLALAVRWKTPSVASASARRASSAAFLPGRLFPLPGSAAPQLTEQQAMLNTSKSNSVSSSGPSRWPGINTPPQHTPPRSPTPPSTASCKISASCRAAVQRAHTTVHEPCLLALKRTSRSCDANARPMPTPSCRIVAVKDRRCGFLRSTLRRAAARP